jgi:hypothetical protein
VRLEGLRQFKKCNDLTGNRPRDLPARSIVPQQTTLPRASVIQGDSGGVTATHGANFLRHFEQKVSYKPGFYTQYLQS